MSNVLDTLMAPAVPSTLDGIDGLADRLDRAQTEALSRQIEAQVACDAFIAEFGQDGLAHYIQALARAVVKHDLVAGSRVQSVIDFLGLEP